MYLPEDRAHTKAQHHKIEHAIRAAAMIRPGVDPDMLGEIGWWRTDDLREWSLDEVGVSDTVEITEDDLGLHFVDRATGQTLVMVPHADIDAAFQAARESLDGGPPEPVVRYSTDLERWTLDADADLFGTDRYVIGSAVGDDTAIAVVAAVGWQQTEDPHDVPPNQIWVGTPHR